MHILLVTTSRGMLDWLSTHGARAFSIIVLAFILSRLAGVSVRRMQKKIEGTEGHTGAIDLRRRATVTNVLSSAIRVLIWSLATLLVLSEVGFKLAPLIAGAGIVGVALGFGAQSLVRDFLSGFFILMENQLRVGDLVDVQTPNGMVSGRVENLTLRTVAVRDFDGTLHLVPNGNITYIGNKSRGWARAIVDVPIDRGEDATRVRGILEELFDELERDAVLEGLISQPSVLGVEEVTGDQVVIRVIAETKPSRRLEIERELRVLIKQRLDERGTRVPVSRQIVISDSGGSN